MSKITAELNEYRSKVDEYNKTISQLNETIKGFESNLHSANEEIRKLNVNANISHLTEQILAYK